jgi:hypothetical protein
MMAPGAQIRKNLTPDVIGGRSWFSEKIVLEQEAGSG